MGYVWAYKRPGGFTSIRNNFSVGVITDRLSRCTAQKHGHQENGQWLGTDILAVSLEILRLGVVRVPDN